MCACNQQLNESSFRHLQPEDLFYQGFFIPATLNCIITQEYWQNLKQERNVTNKQLHIIIVSIKTTTTTTTSLFRIKYSLQSLCPQQRAKKVLSDSPGLVDFAVGLVNSVFNLPHGQVMFYEEFE